ncbi:MAG: hypothetical protein J5781_04245 [Clostridia bacterium]|nr:hypothetical protein [Clostridia bacterium]
MFFFYYCFKFNEIPLNDYEGKFPEDIKKTDVREVTDVTVLKKAPELKETGYFGRPKWVNFERDVRKIKYQSAFVRYVYASLLLKRAVATYWPEAYQHYENARKLPEFGWESLGFSHEKLYYLLAVPEWARGGKNAFYAKTDAQELVTFIMEKVQREIVPLGIEMKDFLGKIIADPDIIEDDLLVFKGNAEDEPEASFYKKFLAELKKRYKKECSIDEE